MACSGTVLVVLLLAAMKSSGFGRLGAACKHTLAISIADLCLRLKPIATVPCSPGGVLMGITSVLHSHQTEFKKRGEWSLQSPPKAGGHSHLLPEDDPSFFMMVAFNACSQILSCSEATCTWINVVEARWCFLVWHLQTFFFFCVFFGLFGYNWSFAFYRFKFFFFFK